MAVPAALTTQPGWYTAVRGIKIARVALTGSATTDVVAAAADQQVIVLGMLYTQASSAAMNIKAKNADGDVTILPTQALTSLQLPMLPQGQGNLFVPHLVTEKGAGLAATHTVNGNIVVWYLQE